MLFSYGSEGVDDDGWGCVYRSFQNAQAHTAYPPAQLAELVQHVGRGRTAWAEPADFADWGFTLTLLAGASNAWLQYTHADQYQFFLPTVTALEAYVRRAGQECAFVVDDGISGYAIVPWEGVPHWVDPHTHNPRRVRFTTQLRRASGWMVLQVIPRSE